MPTNTSTNTSINTSINTAPDMTLYIATDGSFKNNTISAADGSFKDDTISAAVVYSENGKMTQNSFYERAGMGDRAMSSALPEMFALAYALTIARFKECETKIYSDSDYCVKTYNVYLKMWTRVGDRYLKTDKKDAAFPELLRVLDIVKREAGDRISVHHVNSHTSRTEAEYKLNKIADELATAGIITAQSITITQDYSSVKHIIESIGKHVIRFASMYSSCPKTTFTSAEMLFNRIMADGEFKGMKFDSSQINVSYEFIKIYSHINDVIPKDTNNTMTIRELHKKLLVEAVVEKPKEVIVTDGCIAERKPVLLSWDDM